MKNILRAVFVILGTIVGAGFATGQEIYLFFCKYGAISKVAFTLSSIIFGILIYKTLNYIQKNDIKSYDIFLKSIFNKRNSFFVNTIAIIVIFFLGVCFVIMCSGLGAYFAQELCLPNWVGAIVMCIIANFIIISKTNGIIKLNELAIPFLIIIILIISITYNR